MTCGEFDRQYEAGEWPPKAGSALPPVSRHETALREIVRIGNLRDVSSTLARGEMLEIARAALRDGPPGEPSLRDVLDYLRKRPGDSWVATVRDIEEVVVRITKERLGGTATP